MYTVHVYHLCWFVAWPLLITALIDIFDCTVNHSKHVIIGTHPAYVVFAVFMSLTNEPCPLKNKICELFLYTNRENENTQTFFKRKIVKLIDYKTSEHISKEKSWNYMTAKNNNNAPSQNKNIAIMSPVPSSSPMSGIVPHDIESCHKVVWLPSLVIWSTFFSRKLRKSWLHYRVWIWSLHSSRHM